MILEAEQFQMIIKCRARLWNSMSEVNGMCVSLEIGGEENEGLVLEHCLCE